MIFFPKNNKQVTGNFNQHSISRFNFPLAVEQRGKLAPESPTFFYRGVQFIYTGIRKSSWAFSLNDPGNFLNPTADHSIFVPDLLNNHGFVCDGLKFNVFYAAWADLLKKRFFSKKDTQNKQQWGATSGLGNNCSFTLEAKGELSPQEARLIYGGTRSSTFSSIPSTSRQISNSFFDESHGDDNPSVWSPSVQAFLDQPPSSLPNQLVIGGLLFSLSFMGWSYLGTIDEVGKAQGKLVPEGETYKVEPVELGQVEKLLVEEGQEVKAGQLLVELDTELAEKEVERLQQIIQTYELEFDQKKSLRENVKSEAKIQVAIASAKMQGQEAALLLAREKINTSKQLLAEQQTEGVNYRFRELNLRPVASLAQKQLQQLEMEKVAHQKRIEKLLPLVKEGAISREFIFQAEQALRDTEQRIITSQMQKVTNTQEQLFQAEQSLRDIQAKIIQTQGELSKARKEYDRAQAELLAQQSEVQKIQLEASQQIQQLNVELTQLQGKISETRNLLVSAQAKLKHKFLRTPVSGIVLSLDVQNTGEVLEPGHTVAEIAPDDSDLVVSATLPNQEAGFVQAGMPVQIKLDAYPYQDYGVIPGEVISISADAEEDERLGDVYHVDIKLEKDHITENRQIIPFKAGQTVTADIIIRRRRIIDVLLEPIKQIQQDGLDL